MECNGHHHRPVTYCVCSWLATNLTTFFFFYINTRTTAQKATHVKSSSPPPPIRFLPSFLPRYTYYSTSSRIHLKEQENHDYTLWQTQIMIQDRSMLLRAQKNTIQCFLFSSPVQQVPSFLPSFLPSRYHTYLRHRFVVLVATWKLLGRRC